MVKEGKNKKLTRIPERHWVYKNTHDRETKREEQKEKEIIEII